MADQVDQANHDAKSEANAELDKVNDTVDGLEENDVNKGESPYPPREGRTEGQRLQEFKDLLESILDEIQEHINANRIRDADRAMRRLRNIIRRVLQDRAKRDQMLESMKKARKAKRKITAVALALDIRPMADALASVREHLLASNLTALGVPAEISLRLGEMGVGSLRELLAAPEKPARTVALESGRGRSFVPVSEQEHEPE